MEQGLLDQAREPDRDQVEGEAEVEVEERWEEAGQVPVPEETASALPAEPQRHTRLASRVIR